MPAFRRFAMPARLRGTAVAAAALTLTAAFGAVVAAAGPAAAAGGGQTYYVDPSGLDSNTGTSPTAAWRTIAQVGKVTFQPGDQVLLLRGATWSGRLNVLGSGTSTAPLIVGAYGSASAPLPTITTGANGDCVRVNGDYVTVDSIATQGCGYDGFGVYGSFDQVTNSTATNMKVGIKVNPGATFGRYENNTFTNVNQMNVLTQGTNCGTASASNCADDSGATAFLVYGDDNDFGNNTITGSNAFSYDYGRSGAAFQVFNGNRNVIHDNDASGNLAFVNISRSGTGTSNGNVIRANTVTATCGANCTNSAGVTLTGTSASNGPSANTVIDANTFNLVGSGTKGITCSATCPGSTVVTNNVFTAGNRAIWMDGSGWTLTANTLVGLTTAQVGSTNVLVPLNSTYSVATSGGNVTVTPVAGSGPIQPQTYYIDPAGSDTNAGTSPAAAWRSVAKLNTITLQPGDKVLLLRGATFVDRMSVLGSGTAQAPITIGAYGTGALPKITSPSTADCVVITGDYVDLDSIATTGCSYDGFNVLGDHNSVDNSAASAMRVGIRVANGSSFGSYEHNTLTNINQMMVNTPGTDCGTPQAQMCNDDSGATAFLINGDDNDFGFNTVTGSMAASYDYGLDGSAFEIYNANRNVIHDNVSVNNLVLSELGRGGSGTADGNQFRDNTVTANCGTNCAAAGGITLRGAGDTAYGPNNGTVIDGNSFELIGTATRGVSCSGGCPASTVVTNNTFADTNRAVFMDGSGWTLWNNTLVGQTTGQFGDQNVQVPLNSTYLVGWTQNGISVTTVSGPANPGQTYYVDPAGNDLAAGTSPSTAWRTIVQVGKVTLLPGDRVLLKRGASWSGRLNLLGGGTADEPVTISAYGTGAAAPMITTGANGDCVRINGDYVVVDGLATSGCGYDGFGVYGDYDQVVNSSATNMKVGVKVNPGSAFGRYENNTITNVNQMNVLTQGTGCGTGSAVNCTDDSGATAFLVNGDDNDFGNNTITGSNAFSYDYGRSGAAFQVFNGNRNVIHDNDSVDNQVFVDLSRSGSSTANGNQVRANTVSATCGTNCASARGVNLRGNGTPAGPQANTTIEGNTFSLVGSSTQAVTCSATCPATTTVRNNGFVSAYRAMYLDGSGWTVSGNTLTGQTVAQVGSQWLSVATGQSVTR